MKNTIRLLAVAAVAAAALLAAKPASAYVWPNPYYGWVGNMCVTPYGTWMVNPAPVGYQCLVVNPYTGAWATGYIGNF